jgi:hypothetical protein
MDEAQVDTLTIGDHGQALYVEFEDREDAIRVRALLEGGDANKLPVQLTLAPGAEVEGHAASDSVELNLILDDDDTEGHAISVRFPSSAEAARFRRNMMVAGVLGGSVLLGSAGAIAITSQLGAPSDNAPVQRAPAYERPAGHGTLEGVDPLAPAVVPLAPATEGAPAITGDAPAMDTITGRPAGSGFLEGAEGPVPNVSDQPTRPAGSGHLKGVDE